MIHKENKVFPLKSKYTYVWDIAKAVLRREIYSIKILQLEKYLL